MRRVAQPVTRNTGASSAPRLLRIARKDVRLTGRLGRFSRKARRGVITIRVRFALEQAAMRGTPRTPERTDYRPSAASSCWAVWA